MPFQMEESSAKLDRQNRSLHPPMLDTVLPSLSSYALKVPCKHTKLSQANLNIHVKGEDEPCRNTRFLVLHHQMKMFTLKFKNVVNGRKFLTTETHKKLHQLLSNVVVYFADSVQVLSHHILVSTLKNCNATPISFTMNVHLSRCNNSTPSEHIFKKSDTVDLQ
jgi:hypothetical protein